ncbi:MAG: glycoside hydrolase family 3 protein [bacterium]|nr:glycoside hydrolase family 3 protein [bacterium]
MRRCVATICLAVVAMAGGAAAAVDIEEVLAGLSLEHKIGQMHTIGYVGRDLNEPMANLIEEWGIGGFFFQFPENFEDPKDCARVVNLLQEAATASSAGIPLLFSMDDEGGVGVMIRYEQGAVCTPQNMALGASGREKDAYAAYNAMGADMRACGVTVNFAPAIDVLYNPNNPDYTVRLFSGDIDINARMASGAVRGLQDAGVIACPKHWPGLVYYGADTHFSSPHITEPDSVLRQGDFAHFRAAIAADADMIMTHMVHIDAWDPENVVTLSPILVQKMLREDLGFDGLVITDSMSMTSILDIAPIGEASVRSILAGCDIVLQVSRGVDDFIIRMESVREAVRDGRIPMARIDESVRRILRAKAKYGLFENPYADLENFDSNFGQAKHVEANKQAARNGVVVVRDRGHLLPLSKEAGKRYLVVSPTPMIARAGKPAGWDAPVSPTLGDFFSAVAPDAEIVTVNTVPTYEDHERVLQAARDADIIVGYSLLARFSSMQFGLINKLLALGKPTVIVGLGDPSDMAFFPEVDTFVSANSPSPVSAEAAVQVLFGDAVPGGRLPMPIGDLYPIGYAMERDGTN